MAQLAPYLVVRDARAALDGQVSVSLHVTVPDVRTAGGQAGKIEQKPYGLSALCRDDQGLPFWLGQLG